MHDERDGPIAPHRSYMLTMWVRRWASAFATRRGRRSLTAAAMSATPVCVIGLLALALVSCGGGGAQHHVQQRRSAVEGARAAPSAVHRSPARLVPASPVVMTPTPRTLLTFCRENPLTRAACPRRLPASVGTVRPASRGQGFTCGTRGPHDGLRSTPLLYPSKRCVFAVWSDGPARFDSVGVAGSRAAARERTWLTGLGAAAWPTGAHRVSDALLSSKRKRATSLGWVHWYGVHGQLVVTPRRSFLGEYGAHLILYVPSDANDVGYAMTLHASDKPLAQTVGTLRALVRSTALAG
jgi:hypothetical protein